MTTAGGFFNRVEVSTSNYTFCIFFVEPECNKDNVFCKYFNRQEPQNMQTFQYDHILFNGEKISNLNLKQLENLKLTNLCNVCIMNSFIYISSP